ncbi:SDR family oxidoreductase [Adhaeribacter radiodurans]|uniref:SDR family NAD(P)-dependent oxidoreductase n=1 Tax=Adhaeribacter radiodurans TaxID=2745197 RepID=A0A7L7L4B7_9BACT|nr:SDR family oxidoreductase [Adhaeribacter radiodurans]QMU27219.1 SDR family NAD(P)-dependent oxidoreductase [Adhaeribacter radiodurans]
MELSGNTVLITGGASGIGLALAERFLQAGSKVIVCGRREDKLQEAQQKYPQLHTRVCDVVKESDRQDLYNWVVQSFPEVNVLLNNAGIQNRQSMVGSSQSWSFHQAEISINLEAPIHLAFLFIPHLQQKLQSYIINVTSGLAFAPLAQAAIYSATKAALHSFTLSLRRQLRDTSIKVLEIVPPAVQTDLGGAGIHTFGAPLNDFADGIMAGLARGEEEVGYGTSEINRKASREQLNEIFNRMNG